jgi:hypothetical protein
VVSFFLANEPALYRPLAFHVPNLISLFRCLGRARESVHFRGPCTYFATSLIILAAVRTLNLTNIMFYGGGFLAPPPNPQAGGPPPVDCPLLFIQYIRSYPPYLEAVASIRNPRTRHAVVTRDPLNMDVRCLRMYYTVLCSPGQQPLNTLSWKHRTLFPAYSFIFFVPSFFVFLSFILCHIPCLYFVLHGLYYTII